MTGAKRKILYTLGHEWSCTKSEGLAWCKYAHSISLSLLLHCFLCIIETKPQGSFLPLAEIAWGGNLCRLPVNIHEPHRKPLTLIILPFSAMSLWHLEKSIASLLHFEILLNTDLGASFQSVSRCPKMGKKSYYTHFFLQGPYNLKTQISPKLAGKTVQWWFLSWNWMMTACKRCNQDCRDPLQHPEMLSGGKVVTESGWHWGHHSLKTSTLSISIKHEDGGGELN